MAEEQTTDKIYRGFCTICIQEDGSPIGVSEQINISAINREQFFETLKKGLNGVFDRLEPKFKELQKLDIAELDIVDGNKIKTLKKGVDY